MSVRKRRHRRQIAVATPHRLPTGFFCRAPMLEMNDALGIRLPPHTRRNVTAFQRSLKRATMARRTLDAAISSPHP
jgi:hypothetical protein